MSIIVNIVILESNCISLFPVVTQTVQKMTTAISTTITGTKLSTCRHKSVITITHRYSLRPVLLSDFGFFGSSCLLRHLFKQINTSNLDRRPNRSILRMEIVAQLLFRRSLSISVRDSVGSWCRQQGCMPERVCQSHNLYTLRVTYRSRGKFSMLSDFRGQTFPNWTHNKQIQTTTPRASSNQKVTRAIYFL